MFLAASLAAVATVALGGLFYVASKRPDTFFITRSIDIAASPERAYTFLEDFRRWQDWSPYEKLDPAMKREHAGAEKGPGARYAWDSKGRGGAGSMEIVDAVPGERLRIRLIFERPMKAENVSLLTLDRDGDTTRVTWSMEGPANFVSKVFHTLVDIDAFLGKDFDSGLRALKELAEA